MKIDKGHLAENLANPTVQRSIRFRQQMCLQAGLCGDVSPVGLCCTEPLFHIGKHKAHNENNVVLQSWTHQ